MNPSRSASAPIGNPDRALRRARSGFSAPQRRVWFVVSALALLPARSRGRPAGAAQRMARRRRAHPRALEHGERARTRSFAHSAPTRLRRLPTPPRQVLTSSRPIRLRLLAYSSGRRSGRDRRGRPDRPTRDTRRTDRRVRPLRPRATSAHARGSSAPRAASSTSTRPTASTPSTTETKRSSTSRRSRSTADRSREVRGRRPDSGKAGSRRFAAATERDRPGARRHAASDRNRLARRPARPRICHDPRRALRARRRRRGVRDRLRSGRQRAGIPAPGHPPRRIGALTLLDAPPAPPDPERLQRVADLRNDRLGPRPRPRERLPQLLALRSAAPARSAESFSRSPAIAAVTRSRRRSGTSTWTSSSAVNEVLIALGSRGSRLRTPADLLARPPRRSRPRPSMPCSKNGRR